MRDPLVVSRGPNQGFDLQDALAKIAGPPLSSLVAMAQPWVFTQRSPLTTTGFIKEAKDRGFALNTAILRELHRHRLLMPFARITARKVTPPVKLTQLGPPIVNTVLQTVRDAQSRGHVVDPSSEIFQRRLRFDDRGRADPPRWWNGLVYSHYQLLLLHELRSYLQQRRYWLREKRLIPRLATPNPSLQALATRVRRLAVVLTALEPRYLPSLDPEWIHVSGLGEDVAEQWRKLRDAYDTAAVSLELGYTAQEARNDAEQLLAFAHGFDPLTNDARQLVSRLPRNQWDQLRNDARFALDYREAAEMLLRFYEDLAAQGQADALPAPKQFGMSWPPLVERLSYHDESLDQTLMSLGLSPHPRVVLAVEGETEAIHVPLLWRALDYPDAPELMRLLKMGSVDRDLQKVAALAAAPLVARRLPGHDAWQLHKPPTTLIVAVDPEGRHFGTPEKVKKTRDGLITQIEDVLQMQGVTGVDRSDLDLLVSVHTWKERCYEYEHFTDDELADALLAVHPTCNGLTRDELVASIRAERDRRKDIKAVWSLWSHEPSKIDLAQQLWPVLEAKVARCRAESAAPVPALAEVVQEAYLTAQRWRYRSFVLVSRDQGGGTEPDREGASVQPSPQPVSGERS